MTYNGYTTNQTRRLRQHNGEITGGARSTRQHRPWNYLAIISSPNMTKQQALSLEWHIRYPTNTKPRPREYSGPMGRLRSLPLAISNTTSLSSLPELTIQVDPEYYAYTTQLFDQTLLPVQIHITPTI